MVTWLSLKETIGQAPVSFEIVGDVLDEVNDEGSISDEDEEGVEDLLWTAQVSY